MAKVFVSHANTDSAVTNRIVAFLESQGVRCWMAPRDVRAGIDYGEAVMEAIAQCEAMVLVLSAASNESGFVSREVERAVSKDKRVLPIRIENVLPAGALEFYVSSSQWVDAWEEPVEARLAPVLASLGSGMSMPPVARPPTAVSASPPGSGTKRYVTIGAVALGVIALSAGVVKVALSGTKPATVEASVQPPKQVPDDTKVSSAAGDGQQSSGTAIRDRVRAELGPAHPAMQEIARIALYRPFTEYKWCTVVKPNMYQYKLGKGDVLTQTRTTKPGADPKVALLLPASSDFRVTKQGDGVFLMRPLNAQDDAHDEIATFDKDVTSMRVTDSAGKQLSNRTTCKNE